MRLFPSFSVGNIFRLFTILYETGNDFGHKWMFMSKKGSGAELLQQNKPILDWVIGDNCNAISARKNVVPAGFAHASGM